MKSIRPRWFAALALTAGLLASAPAAAQTTCTPTGDCNPTAIDVNHFLPVLGSRGYVTVDSARIADHLSYGIGLYVDFADNLLLAETPGGTPIPERRFVNHRLSLNVQLALGLFDFIEVGLGIPVAILQNGTLGDLGDPATDPGLAPAGLGDVRLGLKFRLLDFNKDGNGFGLALHPIFRFPTGDQNNFLGAKDPTFLPTLVAEVRFNGFGIALNAGYGIRGTARLENLRYDDEIFAGLGINIPIVRNVIDLIGEVHGSVGAAALANDEFGLEEFPLEADGAVRFKTKSDLAITVGGGAGLTSGYGAPSFRVFGGIAYAPYNRDSDGDGIFDKTDRCPSDKEDLDGFEDDDGCPEEDNDGDGIPDAADSCPASAEDKDGFEDEDGCPETDNDGDGIPDATDRCPKDAEDKDGFEDDDGCPDDDNDKDGVPDATDRCPTEMEDKDGYEDDDGCPDGDDDKDGVTDAADRCPKDAEDKDGFEDDDGCPEWDNDKDGIADSADRCPSEPETYNGFEDTDGCPDKGKTLVVVTKEKIEIKEKIFFAFNKAKIEKKSFRLLDAVVTVMKSYTDIKRIRIEGHTDSKGDDASNKTLSDERARSVMIYLVSHGVEPTRLEAVGFGEEVPLADNKTAVGRELNRRVEFTILERAGAAVEPAGSGSDFAPVGSPVVPIPVAPPPKDTTMPVPGLDDMVAPPPDDATAPTGKKAKKPKKEKKPKKAKKDAAPGAPAAAPPAPATSAPGP